MKVEGKFEKLGWLLELIFVIDKEGKEKYRKCVDFSSFTLLTFHSYSQKLWKGITWNWHLIFNLRKNNFVTSSSWANLLMKISSKEEIKPVFKKDLGRSNESNKKRKLFSSFKFIITYRQFLTSINDGGGINGVFGVDTRQTFYLISIICLIAAGYWLYTENAYFCCRLEAF